MASFRPFARLCVAVLAAALCLSLVGCIKFRQALLVMPDGSGKLTITVGMNNANLQNAPEDMSDIDVNEVSQNTAGIVAFSRPTKEVKEGWTYVTFAAYFEDINQVRLGPEEEPAPPGEAAAGQGPKPVRFVFKKEGDGHSLEVMNSAAGDFVNNAAENANAEGEETPPEMKAMMQKMFEGMEMKESYTLPGKVSTASAPLQASGREASLLVTDQDIFDKEKAKKLQGGNKRMIVAGVSEVSDADTAAFKAELTAAKAEWEKIKAEAAAKAAAAPAEAPAAAAPPAPAPPAATQPAN